MFPGVPTIAGGAGGVDLGSAASLDVGDAVSGGGAVNVGGFNVPVAPGQVSGTQMTIIAIALVVAVLVFKKT